MSRYAHATYCDDIRQEVGGKFTLVGVYAGQVLVPEIPCNLAKFCLALYVSATRAEPVKSITVTGVFAGREVLRMELGEAQIEQIMAPSIAAKPDGKRMTLVLIGLMSPFEVSQPGRFSLSVIADGEEIHADGVDISVAPAGTNFSA
ncbi:DUF6941 family protein [Pseudomonas qingdaonensis]|uniref:DUF6941 family protein n=1 Tax=Pseudomonas qingdaonensis TaxID=2056231 RepID=UPI003F816A6B